MISLKTFHLFFIGLAILLTIGYGIFELITPSNPGIVSVIFAVFSFIIGGALMIYFFRIMQKFKTI
tara:strand:+ start:73 stop:270 length:198 start_codon:yes stop_codon:yes gene_type:complete